MSINPIIIIPARMASTRLFGKPLADIQGKAMILHVAERAMEADLGPVIVATDHEDIAKLLKAHRIDVVMTKTTHQSGSDRIFEALTLIDPERRYDVILNVQGDLPTLPAQDIAAALRPLGNDTTDIATLCAEIIGEKEKSNPNVVKVVGSSIAETRMRALYFTRSQAPYGQGPLFHHIGLYAFRRSALEKFVSFAPSTLEKREKLEQLRALEHNMRIDVEIIRTVPLGVDTQEDLDTARKIMASKVVNHPSL